MCHVCQAEHVRRIVAFPFRVATSQGRILYRVNECGQIVVQGMTPPFSPRFGTVWQGATNGSEWVLRTPGDPLTMTRVKSQWGSLASSSSDRRSVDERVLLVSIACESGGLAIAARAEPGYPGYPGPFDQRKANDTDGARDAQDIADPKSKGKHASYGLCQLLLSTAKTVDTSPPNAPHYLDDVPPEQWRDVLFDGAKNIDLAAKLYAGLGAKTGGLDPVAIRFQAGAGSSSTYNGVKEGSSEDSRRAKNPSLDQGWGAESYSDEIAERFIAFWNDLQFVEQGASSVVPFLFGIFNFAAALFFARALV